MGLITTKIHKLHIFQVTNRTFLYISRVVQLLAEILSVGPVFFSACWSILGLPFKVCSWSGEGFVVFHES